MIGRNVSIYLSLGAMGSQRMTLRQKYWISIAVWMSGGFILMLLGTLSPWFIAAAVALMFAIGFYTMNLRCPRCQHPILRGGERDFWTWKAWVPERCVKCGTPLK